ncbi:hypothetical protein [Bradyrhizobium elkanii]|nr:hypothetical protein [Bradyrhizobium elkanii]MCP1967362.1 hypothetical protein [Bradyrhizobium elkanii]MCS3523535.1 hypothetical protein [Bradyrhizobium elkanii]MCS4071190.1 hypothetical protein [Bradyrhizobium elkanii]MCS4077822.1 hypothetical protein [Bradyrhizobium elkanii]MCS4111133.1 hypothetical protein [Bradyrhizobium elkanii]
MTAFRKWPRAYARADQAGAIGFRGKGMIWKQAAARRETPLAHSR